MRLIPAQYVKPYVKTNKSDYIDAEAIAEAVGRPRMRFVPIKSSKLWFLASGGLPSPEQHVLCCSKARSDSRANAAKNGSIGRRRGLLLRVRGTEGLGVCSF